MNTKTCTKCGQEKPLREFHRDKRRKDGRHWCCKECKRGIDRQHYQDNKERILQEKKKYHQNRSPIERSIISMAIGVCKRTRANGEYAQRGIENRLGTYSRIKQYLRENFYEEIKQLIESGKTPSIDRIDPEGHYEDGNVRVIDWGENARLGAKYAYEKNKGNNI